MPAGAARTSSITARTPLRTGPLIIPGRLIRHLEGGELDAGVHELFWDGLDEGGRPVAAGSYVSRLEVNGLKQPGHKLIILR